MLTEVKEGYVKTEAEHGICSIEFHHPQSNSLPTKLLESLAQVIHIEAHNPKTKVLIIRSAGEKVFCSGASFDELIAISTEKEGLQFFSGFAKVINAMRKAPQLIIARVHGKCVGGGIGLVAAADYAIAVEGADVRLTELSIGIGPFVVGPAVQRKLGLSAFTQLSIDSATWRTADWARRKGLYAELHAEVSGMDDSVERLSFSLAHSSPQAMRDLKAVFWQGTENWDELLTQRAAMSGRLILTDYSKDSLQKLRTKKHNN